MKNLSNRVILALLSTLGFASACRFGGGELVMYGTPTAQFKIKATVKNSANVPIPGILITTSGYDSFDEIAAGITDEQGNVDLYDSYFPQDVRLKIMTYDIDGPDNGSYKHDSVTVELKRDELQGATGDWNKGTVEKEVEIILSETEAEHE